MVLGLHLGTILLIVQKLVRPDPQGTRPHLNNSSRCAYVYLSTIKNIGLTWTCICSNNNQILFTGILLESRFQKKILFIAHNSREKNNDMKFLVCVFRFRNVDGKSHETIILRAMMLVNLLSPIQTFCIHYGL